MEKFIVKTMDWDPNIEYKCKTKDEVVEKLIDLYRNYSDNCIGDMLHSVTVKNMSVQDTVDVFAKVMHEIEQDDLIQVIYIDGAEQQDAEKISRWDWEGNGVSI